MLDSTKKTIATLTAAACLGAGGWAIGATSNPSAGTDPSAAQTSQTAAQTGSAAPGYGGQQGVPPAGAPPQGAPPSGAMPQRPDETVLTGDRAAKATAAALAKLPGSTVVRVETDADGGGTYEAHVTRSDGTPATVLMDASFTVTKVLDR